MKKRSVFVKFVEASLACLKLSLPIHCDNSIAETYMYIKNDRLRFVSQFERVKNDKIHFTKVVNEFVPFLSQP